MFGFVATAIKVDITCPNASSGILPSMLIFFYGFNWSTKASDYSC